MTINRSNLILLFFVCIQSLILLNGQEATRSRFAGGTIEPAPNFNPETDARALRSSIKGIGTNDKKLIRIVAGRNNVQRQQIRQAYRQIYKRDLIKDIKGDTTGNYQNLLVALMTPPNDYDAQLIRKSIKGLGTDFDLLLEIMLTRSPEQINALREAYKRLYKKDLAKSIKGDTHGKVEDLLVLLSQGNRDQSRQTDPAAALRDAQRLYQGSGSKLLGGNNAKIFSDILATRNLDQLNLIFDQYSRLTKMPIEETIKKGAVGKYRQSLLQLVEIIRNPPTYFAKRLNRAMKGLGTKDKVLTRIMASRSEIDLEDIKNEYYKLYKKTLEKAVRGDVTGNYQNLLVAIIKGNRKPI